MNDLERDLQEVLQRGRPARPHARHGARGAPPFGPSPAGGVRRRVALSALAIVAGIVAGATTLFRPQQTTQPVGHGPTTTGTMNGIMITYPRPGTSSIRTRPA